MSLVLLSRVEPVVTQEETERAKAAISEVTVSPAVEKYIMDIIWATRKDEEEILIGASPRSTRELYHACKAYVGLSGRNFVLPEDVQRMAHCILLHRMTYIDADNEKKQRAIFENILSRVQVPLEE